MNKLLRLKPYKADKPENTIRKIKNILNDVELSTMEEFFNHEDEGLYSCQVSIYQESLKGLREQYFKTNGKGSSISYSLASAYGELMERIQNSFLFLNYKYAITEKNTEPFKQRLLQENINIDFFSSPEEKILTIPELLESSKPVLMELLKTKNEIDVVTSLKTYFPDNKIVCDKYYNVNKEEVEYLPVQLLQYSCGTNGMCAGNVPKEAIIQGICELFERLALKQIMFNNITPPIIPDSYFADTDIYNKINIIKNHRNLNITIYDCSLGMDFPVIGVLLIDKTNLKYIFHLGSDPNPLTALERGISEIYQGDENIKFNDFHIHRDVYKNKNLSELSVRKMYYIKLITSGAGYYPNNLFCSSPSYEFNGFKYTGGLSDGEDLMYLKNLIFTHGYELFIKDVSYLGFPSYQIYIPGISENTGFDKDDMHIHLSFAKNFKTLLNLKEATNKELLCLADSIDKFYDFFRPMKAFYGNIILHNSSKELKNLSFDIIIALINYKIGRLEQSLKYLNIFTNGVDFSDRDKFKFVFCLRDFIFLQNENQDEENIKSILERMYGTEIRNFVFERYNNSENVFKNLKLSNCFNCDKCLIYGDCKYFEVLKIVSKLQSKYHNNIPDQIKLKQLFDE